MSSTTDIGWAGLAASLVLIAVAVGLSLANGLRLERSILWSALRAAVQLLVVGSALALVFNAGASVALAWVWVAFMVLVAALTVRQRAPEVPSAFALALAANAAVAVVSLGVIFGLRIFPMEPQAIIPLAGMMIGNSMAATVVVSRRVVTEMKEKRPEIEARLALGQPWNEASKPYVRDAMRTALLPQIESTKAVGLIALPGAMTGLILAGVAPTQAVKVQVAVMYLILGSVSTSVAVIGLGLTRRLFTHDHRLVALDRAPA
jgi:putative ABC transport system permease protein